MASTYQIGRHRPAAKPAGRADVVETLEEEQAARERLGEQVQAQAAGTRELAASAQTVTAEIERQAAATGRAREAAQEWARIWDQAARNIQDALGGAFRSALDGGITSFRDFADRILSMMKDIAAQIAAALVFRPVASAA